MKLHILTLFPEIIEVYFKNSIMAKAVEKGIIEYNIVNIRDFAFDKHKTCDDYPYGGGAGMVLKSAPLAGALDSVGALAIRTIYPTPSGQVYTQAYAEELALEKELIFICGRYEGIDQRVIDMYVNDEICVGDYILSSGEIATLTVIDSVYRLVNGVIKSASLEEESFASGLLEYPQYTRPEIFMEKKVPEVLLSGHHENIRKWRLEKSLEKTEKYRPDLLPSTFSDKKDGMQEIYKAATATIAVKE